MKKAIALFLLLASCRLCLGQTDSNVIAIGDWSDPVKDHDGYTLRGRILVYDAEGQAPSGVWPHGRVYLELQHPFRTAWYRPIEVHYSAGFKPDLHFEMRDELNNPVLNMPAEIMGPVPHELRVTLPCDSTLRLRADVYNSGSQNKPEGLELRVPGGIWLIPPNATNDFYLSGTFSPQGMDPSSPNYHVWQGTLKLPKVKIPAKKP